MNSSVTRILNDLHDTSRGSVGSPQDIPVHGWPLAPSVNFSSAYAFTSIDDLGVYHEDKYHSVRYGRDSSVMVRQLEGYFSALFHDAPALLFDSGMSAISAAFGAVIDGKSRVCTVGTQYRKTYAILKDLSKRFGITYIQYSSEDELIHSEKNSANLVIVVESPAHPFLRLTDLSGIRSCFPSACMVLDISFQGLLNDNGTNKSADIIVSSCTKYIGGHNDLLGGVVACNNPHLYPDLWDQRSMNGGIMDNISAYLLFRSLRTYDVRMNKSLENTVKVLEYLKNNKLISRIFYPGQFENIDQETLFQKQHTHGGAVITFEIDPAIPIETNIENLHSTKMAPSFGSVDTLIEIPLYMSHWHDQEHARTELGLTRSIVRLSIGNEPLEAITADLDRLCAP